MENECHFCRGIVTLHEKDDILLDAHADHQVFMHKQCAEGHDLIQSSIDSAEGPIEIVCPKCGAVETI